MPGCEDLLCQRRHFQAGPWRTCAVDGRLQPVGSRGPSPRIGREAVVALQGAGSVAQCPRLPPQGGPHSRVGGLLALPMGRERVRGGAGGEEDGDMGRWAGMAGPAPKAAVSKGKPWYKASWMKANPGKDVAAAEAQAKTEGREVVE